MCFNSTPALLDAEVLAVVRRAYRQECGAEAGALDVLRDLQGGSIQGLRGLGDGKSRRCPVSAVARAAALRCNYVNHGNPHTNPTR